MIRGVKFACCRGKEDFSKIEETPKSKINIASIIKKMELKKTLKR